MTTERPETPETVTDAQSLARAIKEGNSDNELLVRIADGIAAAAKKGGQPTDAVSDENCDNS